MESWQHSIPGSAGIAWHQGSMASFSKVDFSSSFFAIITISEIVFLNVNQMLFALLNSPLNIGGLGSILNIYNVPSEPERAAKARRAVVASIIENYVR